MFFLFALGFLIPIFSFADEFTSGSFKVLDPVISSAQYSTSSSFSLWSTMGEIGIGTSTATSYILGAGFLRFPFVSTPSVSATAGNAQVALSWSLSDGSGGWNPSGYSVGQSTISGGPYTYTNVGNVLSSTRTGLTNATTYYFVIVVLDSFGNSIATSTAVSSTPVASGGTGGGGGGSGGGGGGVERNFGDAGIILSGRAYPLSKVSILRDGQLVATTISGPDSNFSVKVEGLSEGNYSFTVFSEDNKKNRSKPFTFPIFLTSGVTTTVGGIFISPTISVDKAQVKKGDNIVIFGQSAQNSEITISVHSPQEFFVKSNADKNGVYLFNFDTSVLDIGNHITKSKAATSSEISMFSNTATFKVGNENLIIPDEKGCSLVDLNGDCRVNLIDFSILAFWYRKPSPPKNVDVNNDGKIDLIDFSILAFHWTG